MAWLHKMSENLHKTNEHKTQLTGTNFIFLPQFDKDFIFIWHFSRMSLSKLSIRKLWLRKKKYLAQQLQGPLPSDLLCPAVLNLHFSSLVNYWISVAATLKTWKSGAKSLIRSKTTVWPELYHTNLCNFLCFASELSCKLWSLFFLPVWNTPQTFSNAEFNVQSPL